MKIVKFQLFTFRLPLIVPLVMPGKLLTERAGILILLESDEGRQAFGEVNPFPGLHNRSVKECLLELIPAGKSLLDQSLSPDINKLNGGFDRLLTGFQLSSASRFGLEMAILDLLKTFLPPKQKTCLQVNGLLNGDHKTILSTAEELVDQGYSVLKCKVGRQAITKDIALVRALSHILPENIVLRLDANQSWTLSEAVHFFRHISLSGIDYIEEPLKDPENLPLFYEQTGIPYAFDENVARTMDNYPGLKALVLKPNILGGFERTNQRIKQGKDRNLKIVLSDTFNSGLSLSALGYFARHHQLQDTAHGFGTYRFLKKDLLQSRLSMEQGRFDLNSAYRATRKINHSLLKEITCIGRK